MTNEQPEESKWPDSAENLVHTADWYAAPDTRLQWMADTADSTGVGIGITLVVPGGTISGTVIGAQQFFRSTAANFRDATGDDEAQASVRETLAQGFFESAAELVDDEVKAKTEAFENGDSSEPRWPMVRYIHLQDARFSVPGGNNLKLECTRVLLSQVVSWSVGARWWGES